MPTADTLVNQDWLNKRAHEYTGWIALENGILIANAPTFRELIRYQGINNALIVNLTPVIEKEIKMISQLSNSGEERNKLTAMKRCLRLEDKLNEVIDLVNILQQENRQLKRKLEDIESSDSHC